MPRKRIVKVFLSKEQKEILEELAKRLEASESETLRMALMDYAKELSLMEERVRKKASEKEGVLNPTPIKS
ncbi:MAG: ribbon-helix-helix protein, CopG family [Nitrososphaerota archaeon]|nr:ribbon-helix-helix protein, CopG family [Candidatus Bathyarchaeota archaeon]MDW8023391.1 ribbon-helix-helix protein, CopG family [Nitrososphaerota archaeon]